MFGIENFIVFVTSAILLNLYPGPDSLYILSRSISQGRMAGIFAVLGISTGSLVHALLGAVG
jgi:threonine/homoserine/homoserine lactone efflux protein